MCVCVFASVSADKHPLPILNKKLALSVYVICTLAENSCKRKFQKTRNVPAELDTGMRRDRVREIERLSIDKHTYYR